MTTLNTATILANVERYLAQQYYRRPEVRQSRRDGLAVIAAWVVMVWIAIGK